MNYLQYVNLLMGTNSVKTYSNGNVSPIAAVPFGTNNYTLETRCDSDFLFFNPNDHQTTGIRLTHQLSPWLGDYGAITLLPTTDDTVDFSPLRASGYIKANSTFKPNLLKFDFLRYRTGISLAPTMRGATGYLNYPESSASKRLFLDLKQGDAQIEINTTKNQISGFVTNKVLDHSLPKNFKEYFIIKFSAKIDLQNTKAEISGDIAPCCATYSGNNLKISLCFNTDDKNIEYKLATSYISLASAKLNLKNEIGEKSVETISAEGENLWNNYLSKIEIETDDEEQKRTFYTTLWRTGLFPHTFHEFDQNGEKIHYSPANGEVVKGPFYTDMGFWDTYRTSLPLMTILNTQIYKDICLGLLNFYKESGWLPRFSAPGPISCMPGTAIDMVFADAVQKGIITDKNDIFLMLEGMLKHANTPCENTKLGGRDGIDAYNTLGYVTFDHRESVNKTLDYSYGDFCISVLAEALGKTDLANEYKARALRYKNIFNSETNLMKAKNENGCIRTDWREFEWSIDYTEGCAWQNSFSVFHDMAGHAKLMGGTDQMIKMIDKLFELPPIFEVGYRKKEIHEMTEMASVDFGQCALSNQPSFHIPYIYSYMGAMDKTCYQVRRAVKELFNCSEDGFPGDEDTGSMSAWYIFSTLGFYPFTPATGEYILASPSVKGAVIHTSYGTNFEVKTKDFSQQSVYAKSISLNGTELPQTFITHQDIKNGNTLNFNLSSEKTNKEYKNTPFSLSKFK